MQEVFGGILSLKDNVSGVLRQAERSTKKYNSEVAKAKKKLEELDRQKIKQKELRLKNSAAYKAIEQVKKKLAPLSKKVIELKAKQEVAVEKIKQVKNTLAQVKDNKVVNFVAKGVAGVTKAVGAIAVTGAVVGMTAFAAAGGIAIKQAIDFEAQMKNVSTLLDGDVDAKMRNLSSDVKKVSVETGISTENLSSGLYEVISAFGESGDSVRQLTIAAKAAKAGNAETSESVKMLSAVTKGYGDTSAEAVQKAADLAFATVKLGQTSFPELASSMGAVIPLASTLKVSQEELFGAMATLTGVTGNTSEVTTQLKATMQGFMSPSAEMSKALKAMGYESGAAALESEGLGSILNKLKESVNGDEVAFASFFSSVEAKNAVLALAGTQAENFASKTNAMYEASGMADEAFQKQTSSVKEMANKVKNHGMVILMSLGEKALPVVSKALEKLIDFMPKLETTINSVVSKASPIFEGLGNVVSNVVSGFMDTIVEMEPVISDVMSGFGSVVEAAAPVLEDLFAGISSVVETVFPVISDIIGEVGEKVSPILQKMGEHSETLKGIIEECAPAISEALQTGWDIVSPIFDLATAAADLLLSAFEKAFPGIKSVVSEVWEFIKPILEKMGDAIGAVANEVQKMANTVSGYNPEGDKLIAASKTVTGGSGAAATMKRTGQNATGTSYWRGGYTTVGEHGTELIDLPAGAKVYSNSKTNNIMNQQRPVNIQISNMTVREEADIDRIARRLVEELDKVDR